MYNQSYNTIKVAVKPYPNIYKYWILNNQEGKNGLGLIKLRQ